MIHQIANIGHRQCARHRPGQIVRQRGGADRLGVAAWKMAASAGILNLAEKPAILTFYRFGETFQTLLIVAAPDLNPRQTRLVAHHSKRLGHSHGGATRGAIDVILDQTLGHATRRRHEEAHRCVRDPVAQPLSGQCKRREKSGEFGGFTHRHGS